MSAHCFVLEILLDCCNRVLHVSNPKSRWRNRRDLLWTAPGMNDPFDPDELCGARTASDVPAKGQSSPSTTSKRHSIDHNRRSNIHIYPNYFHSILTFSIHQVSCMLHSATDNMKPLEARNTTSTGRQWARQLTPRSEERPELYSVATSSTRVCKWHGLWPCFYERNTHGNSRR